MKTNGLDPDATEKLVDEYVRDHCICATCENATPLLFDGLLECSNPEGGYGPFPVPPTSCCECHTFADQSLEDHLENLMDDWYHSIDWDAVKQAIPDH